MPGPITLILQKKPEVPEYVTNGQKNIAVRMATSNALEELIRKVESPDKIWIFYFVNICL